MKMLTKKIVDCIYVNKIIEQDMIAVCEYGVERWILCLFKSKKIAPCNRCHRHYNHAGNCSEDH